MLNSRLPPEYFALKLDANFELVYIWLGVSNVTHWSSSGEVVKGWDARKVEDKSFPANFM